MRSILLIFFSMFLVCETVLSQRIPSFIPYRKEKKWGYADSTKKILIEPRYRSVGFFNDGVAQVQLNDSIYGIIDTTGKQLFTYNSYERYIDFFYNGLAKVNEDGQQYGFINKKGEMIIPVKYVQIDGNFDFTFGYSFGYRYKTGPNAQGITVCDILDTSGNVLMTIDKDLAEVWKISSRFAMVAFMDTMHTDGLVDLHKKKLVITWQGNDSLTWAHFDDLKKSILELGCTKEDLKLIFPERETFQVRKGYTLTGEFPKDQLYFPDLFVAATKKTYKEVRSVDDIFYPAQNNSNLWGCLDKDGKEVIPFNFPYLDHWGSGLYYVGEERVKIGKEIITGYFDRYKTYYWED